MLGFPVQVRVCPLKPLFKTEVFLIFGSKNFSRTSGVHSWVPMLQSSFRILVALLMAVWMPLCCCQSAMLFGASCQMDLQIEESTGSVSSCCSGKVDVAEDSTCEDLDPNCHGLKSCKCCRIAKRAIGSGLDAASSNPRFEQTEVSLPIAHLASAIPDLGLATTLSESLPFHDYAAPPALRANRAALRWHCALIV